MAKGQFKISADQPLDGERINFRHSREQYAKWMQAFERRKREGKVMSFSDWIRETLTKAAEAELKKR